jgi:hypothetical protein
MGVKGDRKAKVNGHELPSCLQPGVLSVIVSPWGHWWPSQLLRDVIWGVSREHRVLFASATDDVRLFAFVRFTTGDAMSKRSKFALITWIGENVSGLQRAKTGTDKTLVKEVVQVSNSPGLL